jgi:lambda family phage portal protein
MRVPAEFVRHVFDPSRPGQVRGPSWFAPVLLRFKEFDEYEDATLMKQKIAACLAVLTTDTDGTNTPLGATSSDHPDWDFLEPGAIKQLAPGQTVHVVEPPQTREYDAYSKNVLRAIATGIGVRYEDLTGDYSDMPFSAARMNHIQHQKRIHDWRWRIVIPQFLEPAWQWAMMAAIATGQIAGDVPKAKWTPPPFPMVDPQAEGLAEMRNVRAGLKSWSEMVREQGYDPDELLDEIQSDNQKFDARGIVLDSDPRKMTQAGQLQAEEASDDDAPPPPAGESRSVFARERRRG